MRTLLKVSILLLLACGIAAARKAPVRNPKMAAADPGTSSEDRQSQLYCHMVVQQIECKTFHNYCFEGPISCKVSSVEMAAKQASTLPANEAAVSFEALTSNLGQTTVGFVVDGKPYQATVAIDIMEGLKYTAGGPTEAPRCRIENIDHVVDAASWVIFSTRNVATKHCVVSAGLEQSGGSQQWAAAHEGVTLSANAEAVLLQSSEVAEHAEDRSKAVLRLLDFDSVGSTTSRMVVVGSSQQYVVQVALTALDPDGGLGDCVVRNVQSAATHHRMLLAYAQQTRRGEEGEGEDEETGIKVIKSEAQEEDGGAAVDPAVKPVRIKRNVKPIVYPPSNATALRYPIWWFAPFWSGSGYSSEAINYILSIYRNDLLRPEDLWISHHGDGVRKNVVESMTEADRNDLHMMERGHEQRRTSVVVCHSFPLAWKTEGKGSASRGQCPPHPRFYPQAYRIGRTMFETDLIPQSFVKACNAMDEIWVPSEFSRRSFAASGVDPSKLRVVAEGINTTWFDPSRYQPIELPKGTLVFGTAPQPQGSSSSSSSSKDSAAAAASDAKSKSKATEDATAAAGSESSSSSSSTFRFFSNGKWEPRKGYDILLDAYFAAFSAADDVELYILTKPFVGSGDFKAAMHEWVRNKTVAAGKAFDPESLPRLYVIHDHVSDEEFPRYYKAVDAFVLPSRGEGWGRPHVEAMSMGLPIISTNWSGITAFLDETVGYPIHVEGLVPADPSFEAFRGLKWAQPSLAHTVELMRRVYENREEARARGRAARQLMVDKFSPEVLAKVVVSELRRVQEKLEALEAAGQLKPSNVTVSLSASHTAVTTSTAVAHQWPDGLPPSALKAVETAENARMEAAATTTTTAEQ